MYGFLHLFIPIIHSWQNVYVSYYSALILTFIGALPWGFALNDNKSNGFICLYSSIIAFIAWILLIQQLPLVFYALTFVIVAVFDSMWLRKSETLMWFLKLRIVISLLVVLILLSTWLCLR
jgi:uncharacterized membrane protein